MGGRRLGDTTWKQLYGLWKYLGLGYVMAASGRIQYDYKQINLLVVLFHVCIGHGCDDA
jgi:hypothetical protein